MPKPRHEGFIKAKHQSGMLTFLDPKLEWYFTSKGIFLYTKVARLKKDRGVWMEVSSV